MDENCLTITSIDLNLRAKRYLDSLLNKDRREAENIIMDGVRNGVPIKEIYLKIFQPVQWEIGNLWQKNQINVAMEHYCTAATQFIMSRLYEYIFSTDKNGRNMVATSISGELHELGIRMVSDFFEMEGWNTFYLGASTPHNCIIDMINDTKADILAISTTIYFHIPKVEELIRYVRENVKRDNLKIIVGGKAFNSYSNLWREVDADGYAGDADGAIKLANKLVEV